MPYDYNFVLVLLASMGFFSYFAHSSIRSEALGKWIGRIAPFTLGVYLLHGHIDLIDSWEYYMEELLWRVPQGILFLLHMLVVVIIVFAAGILIDMVRHALFRGAEVLLARIRSRG